MYIHSVEDEKILAGYETKSMAYVYRQLIQQVEKINENYGLTKATPIERTFKKFFHKIYQPKLKLSHQTQQSHNQSSYPEVTGLGMKFINIFL